MIPESEEKSKEKSSARYWGQIEGLVNDPSLDQKILKMKKEGETMLNRFYD